MDIEPGRDMLSDLPLGIIHTILYFVPIRDAVRTSVLSRQWRYTWTTLPDLDFEEDHSFGDYYDSASNAFDCMEILITHVLSLHRGPIQSFQFSVPFQRNCLYFGVWLLLLARNDIRELYIDMNYRRASTIQELHSSIYSCKKLTTLELFKCQLDPPPTSFKAFLFLKCLSLESVYLSNNQVEDLVANCPILEEFKLRHCNLKELRTLSELRFSAPNLKVLHLQDNLWFVGLSVCAPLLVDLLVELNYDRQQQQEGSCNYSNILGGFRSLEKLHGVGYFLRYMSIGIESCHTLVFRCLKDISLTQLDFEDIRDVSVVAHLILGAPSLEKLELSHVSRKHDKAPYEPKVEHVSFSDFGCPSDFKLEKLNSVEMRNINGLPPQMDFVRFLLEHSPVLATMAFHEVFRSKLKLSAEFKRCRKASPNVKLVILTRQKKDH